MPSPAADPTHIDLFAAANVRLWDEIAQSSTSAWTAKPARDEALAHVELWSREVLGAIGEPADRRLVQAYLTWRVLRRLPRFGPVHGTGCGRIGAWFARGSGCPSHVAPGRRR